MVVGKVQGHSYVTPIIKELKFSVQDSRVVTTLALSNPKYYHVSCSIIIDKQITKSGITWLFAQGLYKYKYESSDGWGNEEPRYICVYAY